MTTDNHEWDGLDHIAPHKRERVYRAMTTNERGGSAPVTPKASAREVVAAIGLEKAEAALAAYGNADVDDVEGRITDLLTDLLHLARVEGIDAENMHARIWRHYVAERRGD